VTFNLSRDEVAALMAPGDYIDITAEAFAALAEGRIVSPLPLHVPVEGGGFHAKAALLRGVEPVFALKINGNFPGNPARGLPTIQGVIVLSRADDGRVLAVMDSMEVTLRRTAAATAVAARHLARPDSAVVAVIGCGEQGEAQVRALAVVLPLTTVLAIDRDPARAASMADRLAGLGLEVRAASLEDCLRSDVILTCTPAKAPYLGLRHVAPGTFVAAVGADSCEKAELEPGFMAGSKVVCDVTAQCAVMGDLRAAIAAEVMTAEDVHADLGELVLGSKPGRETTEEVIVFDSTGVAAQDLAAAVEVVRRAGRAA